MVKRRIDSTDGVPSRRSLLGYKKLYRPSKKEAAEYRRQGVQWRQKQEKQRKTDKEPPF